MSELTLISARRARKLFLRSKAYRDKKREELVERTVSDEKVIKFINDDLQPKILAAIERGVGSISIDIRHFDGISTIGQFEFLRVQLLKKGYKINHIFHGSYSIRWD